MSVSNSSVNLKLNFDGVVELVLNEEFQKKVSEETSNVALNIEGSERSSERN